MLRSGHSPAGVGAQRCWAQPHWCYVWGAAPLTVDTERSLFARGDGTRRGTVVSYRSTWASSSRSPAPTPGEPDGQSCGGGDAAAPCLPAPALAASRPQQQHPPATAPPAWATPGGPRALTAAQQQPQQQPEDGERWGHGSAPSATQLRAAPRRSPHPACDSPTAAAERGGTGPDGAASGGVRGAERGQRGFGASEGAVGSAGRLEGLRGVLGAPRGVVVPPGVVLEVPGGVPRHCEALQGIKEVTIRCQGGVGRDLLDSGAMGWHAQGSAPEDVPVTVGRWQRMHAGPGSRIYTAAPVGSYGVKPRAGSPEGPAAASSLSAEITRSF